ncbi:uncharacterized protein OCT59_000827 [Rhizophagus irregularis]|uniref:uncharacterized protein n=1 Tax=Rhizophagus irregularis TaxID=588596 RepID=UPI00332571BA|nr:hypothetical protein OCT59_000827 [Rhizophagus irregularis]
MLNVSISPFDVKGVNSPHSSISSFSTNGTCLYFMALCKLITIEEKSMIVNPGSWIKKERRSLLPNR